MAEHRGLSARLGRLFALQLTVIGIATLIGIYITQLVVEDLLTRRALVLEAAHFWMRHEADPQQPLPDTANMRGYLSLGPHDHVEGDAGQSPGANEPRVPAALLDEEPGFRRIELDQRSRLIHVSDRGDARLYLVFNADRVSDLAFYFGTVPLSIVLLLIYAALFIAYRWSQAALSPIVRLAKQLEAVDLDRSGSLKLDLAALGDSADGEVATMIDALTEFTERLDAALERERVFTRDAGHELRTPVAVFKGSLDLLERDTERPRQDRLALARMRRTVQDMESLLETLLLLAREESSAFSGQATEVGPLIQEEVAAMQPLAEQRGNRLTLRCDIDLRVEAPAQVVRIVVGNLLRNALTYTQEGEVKAVVFNAGFRIEDTGAGMTPEELANAFEPFFRSEPSRKAARGHGLGLSIVRRLVRHYGWTVEASSQPGRGTRVTVGF